MQKSNRKSNFNMKDEIENIKTMYQQTSADTTFSTIIMGLRGSGKTKILETCPKPVLVFSFDPKGTIVLRDSIAKGDILVVPLWNEDSQKPTEYAKFEKIWEKWLKSGFIARFGTIALDSATTFIEALTNEVARKRGRTDNLPAIQDYQLIYNCIRDIIKLSSAQQTNFILTAHLQTTQDELTGEVSYEMHTYNKLKTIIPLLFTEKYTLIDTPKSGGVDHFLLTAPYKKYRSSTQLGGDGKFKIKEEPNIKKLMLKAGISADDKPRLETYND